MKNRIVSVLIWILLALVIILIILWVRSSFQRGNQELYNEVLEKMKEGGKIHLIIPDLANILSRPFLQKSIKNYAYLLAAYIEYKRADYKKADENFKEIRFDDKLFNIRDYIYYWWGKNQWNLYEQTKDKNHLHWAQEYFSQVIQVKISPMNSKAIFEYIRVSSYLGDFSFIDSFSSELEKEIAKLSGGNVPELLYIMAESYYQKGNIEKCTDYLVRLWLKFPYSNWASKAEILLGELEKINLIAYPRLEIGKLLDTFDLMYRYNKSKERLLYIKKNLDFLIKKIRDKKKKARVSLLYGKIFYRLKNWKQAYYQLSKGYRSPFPEIKVESAYYLMLYAKNRYYFNMLKRIVASINSPVYFKNEYYEKTVYLAAFDFMRKKRYREAIPIYQKVLRKRRVDNSRYDYALWRLQWCYYHLKQYRNAISILEKLRESEDWREYSLYWTAYIFQKIGRRAEAISLYRQIFTEYGYTYYGVLAYETLREIFNVEILNDMKIPEFPDYQIGVLENENQRKRYQTLRTIGLFEFAGFELTNYIKQKDISIDTDEAQWKPFGSVLSKLYFYSGQYIKAGLHLYRVYKDQILKGSKNIPAWFWKMYYPIFYKDIIDRYARHYQVSTKFLYAFIRQESYYEPYAKSPAGAMGVMQIMPKTGEMIFNQIGKDLGLSTYSVELLFKPEINIPMGIYHLKYNVKEKIEQYIRKRRIRIADNDRFIIPLMIAGYNAGLSRAYRWVRETKYSNQQELIDQIDIPETRIYVKLVLKHRYLYNKYQNH